MNGWQLALALGFCVLLSACSRREGVFAFAPVFTARSASSVATVAECVEARWRQGTRDLQRGEKGDAVTLRGGSLFDGATIGLRIAPDGSHTRVDYFERRRTDPLYWSMVRGCL